MLLFGGVAPRLHLVKVHGNIFRLYESEALRNVKRLMYSNSEDASLSDISIVLSRFSGLEALAVELDSWKVHDVESVSDDGIRALVRLPESLKDFIVIANDDAVHPGDVLRHLNYS